MNGVQASFRFLHSFFHSLRLTIQSIFPTAPYVRHFTISFTHPAMRGTIRSVEKCHGLEGAMRTRNRILLTVYALCVALWILPAADSAVIVRSPYYGSTTSIGDSASIPSSYAAQLNITAVEEVTGTELQTKRVLSAIANTGYPVTPGDTINLFYTEGNNTINLTLQVDGSYRITIPTIGTVDGRGKTFVSFAREVEQLVVTYLPFSMPRVSLVGTGAFSVTVRGEVSSTQEVPAWGLSRLSSVVSSATRYASTREVRVTGADGTAKTYDLYAALREGDLTQNPLVRAGDIVTLVEAPRLVTLVGEVSRPGVYQPLADEGLTEILQRYGNGVLPSGDAKAVLVRRYGSGDSANVDVLRVDSDDFDSFTLEHMDTVFISPLAPLSRAVTIEGAVNMGDVQVQSSALSSSGRVYYQFFPGETILEMMQSITSRFSAVSDLSETYLLRSDRLIPVDVQNILMGGPSNVANLELKEGDRFVVPFNQLFVNVAGGVLRPGTFPYIPDKSASYYINLAGGFDPAKNRNGAYTLMDKAGNELAKDAVVPPEAVVTAKLNTFQAVNGANLATTVTIVGLVATILTIVANVVTFPN
jgi:protein involved in polysaccharide export with SLBB domain